MDATTKKGLIAVAITVTIVGGGFLLYKKFFSSDTTTDDPLKTNFSDLQTNLGLNTTRDNSIIVSFNDKKNTARFYNNGRVAIFNDKNVLLSKGTYTNGGKSIQIDSGKSSNDSSVYKNLINIL